MRQIRYLSLFSGIEAASMAWLSLGWECAGVAEIEPFPCALLAYYYPDVPNLGDVRNITEARIAALGPLDVIVGGFPCQDLSVAGLRKGMNNEDGSLTRSGLFYVAMRIVRWARVHCGLRYLLIENVPGIFSSHGGADFAGVVREMVGADIAGPWKWQKEGAVLGPDGMLEWCVLDARWFGLAQRRRRVFAIADFGDWQSRPPLLLESESLRGDTAPGASTRQDIAPTISARTRGGGGLGTDVDLDGGLIAYAIQERAVCTNPQAGPDGIGVQADTAYTLEARSNAQAVAYGGNNQAGAINIATAVNAHGGAQGRLDFESETFIVAQAYDMRGRDNGAQFEGPHHTANLRAADGGSSRSYVLETAHALTGEGFDASEDGTGRGTPLVPAAYGVRRLTPRECERLQGFPDDYTNIIYRGKPAADGPRYKALGNSMAVPVMRWIGHQIHKSLHQ